MNRKPILELLRTFQAQNAIEEKMQQEAVDFIKMNPKCFDRSLLTGHVTGSSWIVNGERTHALLMHHKKLDKWFQPGGHCDGDWNVLNVAIKEAQEETGLIVYPVNKNIYDIDNHIIPVRNDIPEHIHYDIRFFFKAEKHEEELPSNSEATSVRWIKLEDVHLYNSEPSIIRMVNKTKGYFL